MNRLYLRNYSIDFVYLSLILIVAVPGALNAQEKRHDDLFSVTFANEKQGWACGRWGTIVHTSDGGTTWICQKSSTDYTLTSISFVDAHYGWAVGDGGTIVYTEDGGKSWAKQTNPDPCFLMGVKFVSRQKGWAVGEWTTILFTDDGGKNWRVQFKDEDYILKAVSFCDEQNGWAVGEYGYIYHTSDGGDTWDKQAGSFRFSIETGDIEGENFLFNVAAIDPNTAWAVGIEGYVIQTSDGGKTWQEVKTDAGKSHLYAVCADTSGRILSGGRGIFVSSADKGKTWQVVSDFSPPIIYGWIYSITPRAGSGFAAVGWNGSIYLSEKNDRLTWRRIGY